MPQQKRQKSRGTTKKKRLQAIYAKSRREFSAADLQKYTVTEPGVPLKKVVAAMERIQNGHQSRKT